MPLSPIDLLQLSQGAQASPAQPVAGPIDFAQLLGYSPAQGPVVPAQSTQPAQPEPDSGALLEEGPKLQAPDTVLQSQPADPGLGTTVGVGGSSQAFSPTSYDQIQRGPGRKIDKQIAGDRAAVQAQYAPLIAELGETTAKELSAQEDVARLESQKLGLQGEAKLQIANAKQDFLAKEQAASAASVAESAASIAQYRTALAEYSAAKVNPTQLWDHAGASGQVAMLATAFAHDFLGAKGIKTSGMDSIRQAVQNNINAQLENIRKKRDVAQGFKELWEMQRMQSSSDAEARARMHGFYLEALGNEIESKLLGYDSQLALSKAQVARAEITKEKIKNDLTVQRYIEDAANDRARQRVQIYQADLSASTARYSADAHMKASQLKADAEARQDRVSRLISDPSVSGGDKVVREFLPKTPPETMAKFREQNAKVLHTVSMIEKLVQLQDQIDHVAPTGDIAFLNRLKGERERVAEMVRNQVRMGIIYDNSGKQINEKEMEIYEQIVGKKDWFLNGDNTRQFGELAGNLREKNDMVMNALSVKLPENDPFYGQSFGHTEFDPANKALTDVQRQPGGGKVKDSEADDLAKQAVAPKADEPAFKTRDAIREFYGHGDKSTDQKVVEDLYSMFLQANPKFKEYAPEPSKAFVAVNNLNTAASEGDAEAQKQLDRLASEAGKSKEGRTANDHLIREYAAWFNAVRPRRPGDNPFGVGEVGDGQHYPR